MTKHFKLALLALVLSAFASAKAATTAPPKVVFVGDYITYQWASAFAANPNWINLGNPEAIWLGSSEQILGGFQAEPRKEE
jgi:hypothetical protein